MAIRHKIKLENYLGKYSISNDSVVGKLKLRGASTVLRLYSGDEVLPFQDADVQVIRGYAYSSECLTLVDCCFHGEGRNIREDGSETSWLDTFPHYVVVGGSFIDPDECEICSIRFTVTDAGVLFNDSKAFGHVIDSKSVIDAVLEGARGYREVETGEHPYVFYYTGKQEIVEVVTDLGRVSVTHRPDFSPGTTAGISVGNRIVVSIEPLKPIAFDDAVERMYTVATFFSIAAGRAQGIDNIEILKTTDVDKESRALAVHPSFKWKVKGKDEGFKPHVGDLPLDPVSRPTEFDKVLSNWVSRHAGWRTARSRYLECIRRANKFGVDRLVAAANMFDILPLDVDSADSAVSTELSAAVAETKSLFRKLPKSAERNSVLDALGRLGKPSLPKKVYARVKIVDEQLAWAFPDLHMAAIVAIKYRNYFVHGSSSDLDIERLEHFLPFLTNLLEFIFSVSDFIEAGWDALSWSKSEFGSGHSFSRFRREYLPALSELKAAIAKDKGEE